MSIENPNLFNVRIKNKYDTLDAWNSSQLVLEAGEIAIAYTSVDVTVDEGTVKQPALLMKVGDGIKTFAELPWLSAKAADVLSACKSTTELTKFVTNVVNGLGIASDEAMQALTKRVTTAEGAIDALELLVGTKSVSDQIAEALNTYATKEYTDKAAKDAADSKNDAIAAAKKAGDDAQDTIDAYIESNNTALAKVKATADAAAVKEEVNAAIAGVKATADAAAVKAEVEQALAGKAGKATTLAGYGITDAMTAEAIAQAIATAKAGAEKYADDNDQDTKYGIVYDSTNKEIKLVAGGTDDTIDATDFIKDGMISKVELDEDHDLIITFNTDAGADDIVVPLDKLIDTYVGKATDTVNVTVEGREISATVKDGSISESHLNASVNASLDKADSAIQSVTTGKDNGAIAVDGTDVKVKGLGSAAYKDEGYFDKANAAATAKSDVIGKSGDAASANTIYGAKKYADEKAAEAKQYADDNDANTTYSFNIPTEGNDKGKLVITPSEGKATTLDIATQSELDEALVEAKGYTDDEIAKLDGEVKVTEITDKSGYNVLTSVTQADGKLTSKTELKLSNLAVTGSTDDLVQGTMTLVFDCGNSK